MQLNNVKKKVEKASAKLGLGQDEAVLAACTTNPSGTVTRLMAKELGGVLATIAADRKQSGGGGPEQTTGAAERFPSGQHYLVVTNRRVLAFSVAMMSGKPKELQAEWPTAEVLAINTEPGKLAVPMAIAFADGSEVQVEAARGTGAESLPEALQAARLEVGADPVG